MEARADFERYTTGARTLENVLVLVQGGLRTRYGTRWVAETKDSGTRAARLFPFEASGLLAYKIEAGHFYFRFYDPDGQIVDGGLPVELATPYAESDLPALKTVQLNDVMLIAHPNYPPAQLSRIADNAWTYKPILFDPPALFEAGTEPNADLSPSALTGSITLTASAASFLETDVDRILSAADARVAITGYTSTTVVTGDVLSDFSPDVSLPIPAGEWKLERSPVGELQPDKQQPTGATVTLDLRREQETSANLITNGTFTTDLTGWTNISGPLITSGTYTGVANETEILTDSTKHFYNVGARPGQLVVNVTDGSRGVILALRGTNALRLDTNLLEGGTENDFDTGDSYQIIGTGGAEVRNGKAYLTGNPIGVGWIEQGVATVVGTSYLVQFDSAEGNIAAQVGSASGLSDLKEELGYDQGNEHKMIFIATTTTSYIQFRNNQPSAAAVDNVTCRVLSATGWRLEDVGKYLKLHEGLVKITQWISAVRVKGTILRELTGSQSAPLAVDTIPPSALAGAWQLLSPAWSDASGWPNFVTFFEGRLYFTGVAQFPQELWASKVNDFFNFFEGPNPDDALHYRIIDSSGNVTLNQIQWLAPGENLLAGTTHGEYRLSGPADGAFSAADLPLVRLQSTYGSAAIQPIRVGQSLLFVQRQGSKIRNMAFEADVAAAFLAKDITNLSGHLLEDFRVVELTYQPEAIPLVWVVRSDGKLLTLTFDLVEQITGWSHQSTQGAYESIAVTPHVSANSYEVSVIVRRTINGVQRRFIETFDDQALMSSVVPIDGELSAWRGLTLDCAVLFTFATARTALTGLEHLAGAEVTIVADGVLFPAQTVTVAGTLTLPVAARTVWVGLPYTCTGETLPLETMLRTGITYGQQRNWVRVVVQLYKTIGLRINDQQMPFRTPAMPMGGAVPPFTGKIAVIPPSEWSLDSTIRLVQEQPFPATILAVSGDMDLGGTG